MWPPRISKEHSQIAILVCSNIALQICKLAASLTRHKLETSFCQRVSHLASSLQQACCVKHIENYSKKYADEFQIRNSENPFPKPVVFTTQPEGLRLRKIDCATERLKLHVLF
ncbi:hypothetical protein AVEN_199428-1 [Araneus ventricosus]|uniref:Uncharacterized protein n=1 Tax=Araneus ventricosus TaxID=182803 RepID=A0A4Y2E4Z0_ARAVE|nr:hypothetical protein AVEN_119935-1 [Araneus ventricosus]GBM24213.1 hypothetical protein AVEN_199428-1 [Araneus ventricosus]